MKPNFYTEPPRQRRAPFRSKRVVRMATATVVGITGLALRAPGQTIVDFNANLAQLSGTPSTVTANYVAASLGSPITLSRGAGVTPAAGTGRFSQSGVDTTSLALAISGNDYDTFTITPNAGYAVDLARLDFSIQSSGTGATRANILGSATSFAAANTLQETTLSNGTTVNSYTFATGGDYSNRTTATELRFYFHGASGSSGTTSINTLFANGLVSARWDGGAGNDNLNAANNYVADALPASTTNGLQLEGSLRTSPNVNLATTLGGLRFAANASAFTVIGNANLTLSVAGNGPTSGGIANYSTALQTVNAPLILGAAQTWNAANGALAFGGPSITNGGFALTITGANNVTINNPISGSGNLTKSGAGQLVLGGNSGAGFTGQVAITGGSVQLTSAGALGATASGQQTIVSAGAALDVNGLTIAEPISLNGTGISNGGALFNGSSSSAATLSAAVTLQSAARITSAAGGLTLSGGITGTGFALNIGGAGNVTINTTGINTSTAGTLTKDDAGVLSINAGGSYTGLTTINGGTIKLGSATALGTADAGTTIASGATLDLNGQTVGAETISLIGTGVGANGALVNNSANAASLSGTVTLTGAASIGGSGNLSLAGIASSPSRFDLTKVGSGKLTLTAGGGYNRLLITGGMVSAANINSSFGYSNVELSNGGIFEYTGATFTNALSAAIIGNATDGYIFTLQSGGGAFSVSNSTTTFALNNTTSNVNKLTGSGAFTKTGAGTLLLSASNDFGGPTSIVGGTLAGSVEGAFGTNTADVNISNSALISYQYSPAASVARGISLGSGGGGGVDVAATSVTMGGVVSGSGAFRKEGAGMLALTGSNTYSGATTIAAGVLSAQNNAALGTTAGATTVANGASLQVRGGLNALAEAITLNGAGISGDGALHSTLGNNTLSGPITLATAARIQCDANTLTLGGGITGAGGLTVGGSGNTTIDTVGINTTTASATLTKQNSGALRINADSSYAGATTINGGYLLVNAALASASTTTVNGGTLGGNGTLAGPVDVKAAAHLAPGDANIASINVGALTLEANANFDVELNGPSNGPVTGDVVVVTNNAPGTVNVNGAVLNLSLVAGGQNGFFTTAQLGPELVIVDNPGTNAVVGTFATLAEGAIVSGAGGYFRVSYTGGTGNDITLTTVPEPASIAMLFIGASAGLMRRRRRAARSKSIRDLDRLSRSNPVASPHRP